MRDLLAFGLLLAFIAVPSLGKRRPEPRACWDSLPAWAKNASGDTLH